MQVQQLTRPLRVETERRSVVLPRPDRRAIDVVVVLASVTAALLWVAVLVMAVPAGVLCAAVDGLRRRRRPAAVTPVTARPPQPRRSP